MILWYPYYEFRFYLHRQGMSWDDISLLSIAVIGIILFISKHLTEFIISSFFKATVNINDDFNQNELKNKNKKEEYPLQKTVKVWKILSKRSLIVLIFIISIPLIYMGIKQKERKDLLSTIEKAENQSLILSEEKKRIANEKRVEALKTKRADFEHKKEKLENSVSNWENKTSNLKKQIDDIKAKYGSWRGGKYTQSIDFSLADKHALRQLLKEGDELKYERLGLQTRKKDIFYLFKSFEKEFYENETYKYQDGTYRHQMLNEITQIDDVLKISIFDSFDMAMLGDIQKRQSNDKNKTIVKNAEYYLELATDRMKVDESGRFDMTNKDWDYVVENINKSLDLDSDFLLAYLFRGNAYYYMQEYRKSMKDYKKITRVPKYRFESTEELSVLSMAYIGLGNAKLELKLNYCSEYKKACDLGDCLEYYGYCK